MKINLNGELESLYSILEEEKKLQDKKSAILKKLEDNAVERVSNEIRNAQGQKIVMTIEGVYLQEKMQGLEPIHFKRVFIGKIHWNAPGLIVASENEASRRGGGNNYEIPAVAAYAVKEIGEKLEIEQSKMYLHYPNLDRKGRVNSIFWHMKDFWQPLLPEELFSHERNPTAGFSTVRLYIGDSEFNRFLFSNLGSRLNEIAKTLDELEKPG